MDILSLRQNLGICLVFVGVTTSMFLNYFFPITYWTPIVMFLSCLLLCDSTTFTNKTSFNKTFKALFCFQLIMLVYFFFTFNEDEKHFWNRNLSFHLYIITLLIILSRTPKLKERQFLPVLFIYSSLLSAIAAICHYTGLIELDRTLNQEDAVLEVFTCNIAAYISFITCLLLMKKRSLFLTVLIILVILLDFYVIMMSAKRSYYVSVLIVGLIYLYKIKKLKQGLTVAALLYIIMVALIPEVREMTVTMIDRTIEGFSTVYIDKKNTYVDINDSASIRAYTQRIALIKLENFSIINYIFGGGYLFHFFDNPLGESYIDMGIIGLCFYTYLIVIVPIRFFHRINFFDKNELFCFFVSLMNICIILVNNDPYTYLAYTPLCMMAIYSYKSDFKRYKIEKYDYSK